MTSDECLSTFSVDTVKDKNGQCLILRHRKKYKYRNIIIIILCKQMQATL